MLAALAARNMGRHPLRTALTVAEVAVAVLAFLLLRTAVDAWHAGSDLAAHDRLGIRNRVSFTLVLPRSYADRLRQVDGVKAATFASWFNGRDPRQRRTVFTTLAVDPPSYLEVFDEIELNDAERQAWLADRQGAVLGDVLARQLGVQAGDTLTLAGTVYPGDWRFRIDGIYHTKRDSSIRSQLLFHWDYLNQTVPEWRRERIGYLVARVTDPARAAEVGRAIDTVFESRDVRTLTMSERAVYTSFLGMLSSLLGALDAVSLVILAVMMLVVGNTIAMSVRERTSEHAVLRALGFRPRHLAALVVGEAALLAVLGGALGLAITYPLVGLGLGRWFESHMSGFFPYFRVGTGTAAIAMVLALSLGFVASLAPAWRVYRLSIAASLRREGD